MKKVLQKQLNRNPRGLGRTEEGATEFLSCCSCWLSVLFPVDEAKAAHALSNILHSLIPPFWRLCFFFF